MERDELDRRAHDFAVRLLSPLPDQQRERLASAMAEVERLLTASMVTVEVEDPAHPAARWCLERYFAELDERFARGFDPGRSSPVETTELRPPAGLLLVARLRGRAVGCGGLRLRGDGVGELKRMWVARDARGLGRGRRLLHELEERARQAGVRLLRLETNGALAEAIPLYRSSGSHEVEPFNDEPCAEHWFAKWLDRAR